MKRLRFAEPLPSLILNGYKNTTWRIDDDKDIQEGDEISFCGMDCTEFAKAKVFNVTEKKFKDFTEKDKDGHEKFDSDREMYETYSKYYNMQVTPQTMVKVIKFKLF